MKMIAFGLALAGLLLTAGVVSFLYVYPKTTLLDPDKVVANFSKMDRIFPSNRIAASSDPQPLPISLEPLPETLEFGGERQDLNAFLSRTQTTSLTIVRDGTIVGEEFRQCYDRQSRTTSFSVAKSFVSTLIGVALHKNWIEDIDDPVIRYLPELAGSAWDGVRISDVLQMSSGIGFTEQYDDTSTDAFTIYQDMFVFARSIDALAAGYPRAEEPGTVFSYASINSHLLAMLLRRVSGKPLGTLLQEELWEPLGAEASAFWLTDLHNTEIGFWGLSGLPRDFARLGMLMLDDGVAGTRRLLPKGWAARATQPDQARLQPGRIDEDWGYQYQWWVPQTSGVQDYSAIGIWGQFIYVNPEHRVVIVKTSADPDFKANEYQTILMFRALARHVSEHQPAMNSK